MANETRNIAPSQWKNLFPNAKQDRDFINITAWESPKIDYATLSTQGAFTPTSIKDNYMFFYPRNTIREDISHNYGVIESTVHSILSTGKDWAGKFLSSVEQVKNQFSGTSQGILIEQPTYFLNSNKRKFDMIIDLYQTGDIEQDIYRPITFFKKYSHATKVQPKTSAGQAVSDRVVTIKFPSTFTISGGVFNRLASDITKNHFVLLGMSTEFNPDLQFVDEEGLPVHARLTLSFEEIQSLLSEDWDDLKKIGSITEAGLKIQ